MHQGETLFSFFTGAAIVHVPLTITSMSAPDPAIEIMMFLAKSVIGGIVSVLIAHVAHRKQKNQNNSNEQGG